MAVLAHLGVPFLGLLMPLVIWLSAQPRTFTRIHARQAFSYQCIVFPCYLAIVVLVMFGVWPPWSMPLCLAIGFAFEVPQIARAMGGRRPLRLPPFVLLRQ